MSFELEQVHIFKYIQDNWASNDYGLMVYPNYDEPSASSSTFYTSVVLIANEAARMRNSIGAPRLIRNYGFIFFTIYAPKNTGTLKQTKAKDAIARLFDEKVIPLPNGQRVVCGISAPQTLGLKDNLYRMVVNVPFHRDEWPTN